MISHSLRKVIISVPGITMLYVIFFAAFSWLSGARNAFWILASIAVGLTVGIYAAIKTRKSLAYYLPYVENDKQSVLKRFKELYDTAELPANNTECKTYLEYLNMRESTSRRVVKQGPMLMLIILLGCITLTHHGRINIFTFISALTFGAVVYSYTQGHMTIARVALLKQRIESSSIPRQAKAGLLQEMPTVSRRYPLLYLYAFLR